MCHGGLDDLTVYRAQYGLPALADGQFRKVNQRGVEVPTPRPTTTGPARSPSTSTWSRPSPEREHPARRGAGFDDLGASVNQAVALGATYVSNSYGSSYTSTPGSGEDPSEVQLTDAYYKHPGVAVVASSGDDAPRAPARTRSPMPSPARSTTSQPGRTAPDDPFGTGDVLPISYGKNPSIALPTPGLGSDESAHRSGSEMVGTTGHAGGLWGQGLPGIDAGVSVAVMSMFPGVLSDVRRGTLDGCVPAPEVSNEGSEFGGTFERREGA